ncbi:MAG: primosomal protein N' [Sporolactobacillus sp.]
MIAEIYVDIPAVPVDRPFDYLVPNPLREVIQPGMRVSVPFGRTRRLGFVTQVKDSSDVSGLKPIDQVIDPQPVLTQELLELGHWLAETTLCLTVTAYQAMLPAVMKAEYRKQLAVTQPESFNREFPELQLLFAKGREPEWESIAREHPELLKSVQRALNRKLLSVTQMVKNQAKVKTAAAVRRIGAVDALEEACRQSGARARRQKEALLFFIDHPSPTPFAMKQLTQDYHLSREALHRLEEKKLVKIEQIEIKRDPYLVNEEKRTTPLPLTDEQAAAIKPIFAAIASEKPEIFLCHGVTGSGKTEIYLQAIERVIDLKKQAIVLVPEISLTPLMVHRFKGRFGDQVAVLHSGLSRGEKYDEWRKIRDGQVSVVVGARSAVFAPFKQLGLIIIDEEHESSYKQEDHPRYHARDVAVRRANGHHCPVLLGSATPSLESYARAQKQVYTLLTLKERFNHHPLPPVKIIDMREEMRDGNHSVFSRILLEKIKNKMERGEQTVLFLNRRGYATFVMCRSCGTVIKCPHCDISLTYHRAEHLLKCHYCGHAERVPQACPSCGSDAMRYFGAGTQKVEVELNKLVPEARIVRMDVDTTRKKGGHEKLLRRFGDHEADILLGTQMIAKGLDFPNVTLVGVLAADSMLHLPDFRASEKTFQLLTQVSGRAGRHDLPGEVIIQSYSPDHYAVTDAARHDYQQFYNEEMQIRRRLGYPPYYYLVLINVSHPRLDKAAETAERVASALKNNLSDQAQIYGPVVPAIARIKDRYRYQCMVKYKREPQLIPILRKISRHFHETGKDALQLSIDLNPVVLM